MQIKLTHQSEIDSSQHLAIVIEDIQQAQAYCTNDQAWQYVQSQINEQNQAQPRVIHLNQYTHHTFFVYQPTQTNKPVYMVAERLRKAGHTIWSLISKEKLTNLQIASPDNAHSLELAEGLLLSSYQFLKYKKEPTPHTLAEVMVISSAISQAQLQELENIIEGTFAARDLVNEPFVYLTAPQLSEEIKKLGQEAGFDVEVFDKAQITAHNMEGLLTVNKGSVDPPTFNILTHKPANAVNEQPYILVGKGVVYDTGGLSLKPTGKSMDFMKSDMGGAAAVIGSLYTLAKNNAPIYVIGLIPATDNRPGVNAIAPGDVITYANGKSVEIMNTDAEGRLILADALIYAKRFNPALVLDFATLTGSAVRALGNEALVMMGTAERTIKNKLIESSEATYERMVEFPMWEEYGERLKSDIADINNLGTAEAQAIIAGKFLEHFVEENYPWIHMQKLRT